MYEYLYIIYNVHMNTNKYRVCAYIYSFIYIYIYMNYVIQKVMLHAELAVPPTIGTGFSQGSDRRLFGCPKADTKATGKAAF